MDEFFGGKSKGDIDAQFASLTEEVDSELELRVYAERYAPEVIEQLDAIEHSLGGDAELLALLQKLELSFKPSEEVPNEELVTMVEGLVEARLPLDTAPYMMQIDGSVGIMTDAGDDMWREVQLDCKSAVLGGYRLLLSETDKQTYCVAFSAYVPAPERDGGWLRLTIPAVNVTAMASTRIDILSQVIAGERPLHGDNPLNDQPIEEVDASQVNTHELAEMMASLAGLEQLQQEQDSEDMHIEALRQYEIAFQELIDNLRALSTIRYPTQEAALACFRDIGRMKDEFVSYASAIRLESVLMRVSGAGLIENDVTASLAGDADAKSCEFTYTNLSLKPGDALSSAEGSMQDFYTRISMDDDGEYRVSVLLQFVDKKRLLSATITDRPQQVPVSHTTAIKYFYLDTSNPDAAALSIELEAYEKMRDIRNRIQSMDLPVPTLEAISNALDQLLSELDQGSETEEYIHSDAIDSLCVILQQISLSDDRRETLAQAINLVTENGPVCVSGAVYDIENQQGELFSKKQCWVDQVIAAYKPAGFEDITFLLRSEGQHYAIRLSDIESLEF